VPEDLDKLAALAAEYVEIATVRTDEVSSATRTGAKLIGVADRICRRQPNS
jgi:hypothetical protein